MFTCKGVCKNEMHVKSGFITKYGNGYKKCIICEKTIKTDNVKCYCCHCKLRTNSRKNKFKQHIRKII